MGHSLKKTSFEVKTSLSIKDGSEAQGYVLMSDEIGNATWKDPKKYITAKTSSHYIGEMFGGGVVVSVWNESGIDRCLVASPECISTLNTVTSGSGFITSTYNTGWSYGFSFSSVPGTFSATSSWNGYSNTQRISTQLSSSAAARCMDYVNPDTGSGIWDDWFLPSIMELKHLGANSAIFNKVLQQYAFDKEKPTIDWLYNSDGNAGLLQTDRAVPTDINFFRLGSTTYKYSYSYFTADFTQTDLHTPSNSFQYASDVSTISSDDSGYYWSSTENISNGSAWALVAGTYSEMSSYLSFDSKNYTAHNSNIFGTALLSKSTPAKVRPFRLADDTQKQFYFDADYIVITYVFSGERDLDTRTSMVVPNVPASESGYGTPYRGVGWTPDAPLHPASSTYSVIWHAGDNTGYGFESVLINLNAFRYYYPGQAEIVIDARAHWYTQSWQPSVIGWTADQIKARLDATEPVNLQVKLYKGGEMSRSGYAWTNTGATAEMMLDSYSTKINMAYSAKGMRVSKIKYNLIGKFGYLQLFD